MKSDSKYCGQTEGYLNHIRSCLWKGKPHGRAALMVGAGFSLNAEYVSGKITKFPEWAELARTFADHLVPNGMPNRDISALELAARFEAVYDRGPLHDLILEQLPDSAFRPGALHIRLLDLPWADVFTTNYDTFLDRACKNLSPERSYRIIRRVEGLPGSKQPRIVKLHGSFPDTFPFIITEDDFRTYPQRFAPFVNTVQQSMMENVFCLLGFSGQDPNFVNWTGWVRDNLKENCPKIYLCGVFGDIDDSRIAYLRNRNVTLVDLRFFLFDGEEPSHATLIGRYIDFLGQGRPPEAGEWGSSSGGGISGGPGGVSPSQDADGLQVVGGLEKLRETYPGWLVCPRDIRSRYWNSLKMSIQQVDWLELKTFPLDIRLTTLCEIAWGLRLCLSPMLDSIREHIVLALEDCLESNHRGMSSFALELMLVLVRDARERFDLISYEQWRGIVQSQIEDSSADSNQRLALHYEDCLHAWYQLNFGKLLELVEQWPSDGNPPVWSLRHASLLLVIGDANSAWKLLEATLVEIRSRQIEAEFDIGLLSEESWVMYLLQRRHQGRGVKSSGPPPGRWDELRRYHCDPFRELNGDLIRSSRKKNRENGEYETFDVGIRRVFHTVDLGSGIPSERGFGFEAFTRLHEDSGCPMVFGCYRTLAREMDDLLPSLSLKRPEAFFSHVMRFDDMDSIKRMSRFQVLAMDTDAVGRWYRSTKSVPTFLMLALSSGKHHRLDGPRWSSKLDTYLELVSRLTIKFDEELLDRALELACSCYVNVAVRIEFQVHESLGNLFRRAIVALSEDKLVEWIPKLINLPLGDANGTPVGASGHWPEPLRYVAWTSKPLVGKDLGAEASMAFLLSQTRFGEAGYRGNRARAIERLGVLYNGGGMVAADAQEFARELWSKREVDTGLPALEGNFYIYSLLTFPEPSKGYAASEIKRYLKSKNLSELYARAKESQVGIIYPPRFLATLEPILDALLGCTKVRWQERKQPQERQIAWTQREARTFLTELLELWCECREELVQAKDRSFPIGDQTRGLRRFGELISTLATKVFLPYAKLERGDSIDAIYKMLQDMSSLGVPVEHNAHMLLWSDWGFEEWVFELVRSGLRSDDSWILEHTYIGILHWALMAKAVDSSTSEVPREFVRTLLSQTLVRDRKGYHTLLEVDSFILEETDLFTDEDKMVLCDALEAIGRNVSDTESWRSGSYAEFSGAHHLAAVLSADFAARGEAVPSVLGVWRSNAKEFGLPDLMRHWEIGSARSGAK